MNYRQTHEIDYRIHGEEMQCVEIELDPNETAIAESGTFMMMDDGIQMQTIFGDGSRAGKRIFWQTDVCRQTGAYRRKPVYDCFYQYGTG